MTGNISLPRLRLTTYDHRAMSLCDRQIIPRGCVAWVETWTVRIGPKEIADRLNPYCYAFVPGDGRYTVRGRLGAIHVRLNHQSWARIKLCDSVPTTDDDAWGIQLTSPDRGYLVIDNLVGVSFDFVDSAGVRLPDEDTW